MSDRGGSPPGSRGSRGPSPSRSPAPGSPRPPGSPGPSGSWPQGLGVDPARPRGDTDRKGNTRMELPADAYITDSNKDQFPLRKGFNTEGKPEMIEVNQYRMTKFDFSKKIYQYDVALSPAPDKIGPVMKKIWVHPTFKNALQAYNYPMWISDHKFLAWAPVLVDRNEVRVQVDLDAGQREAGKPPRAGNVFNVTLRKTTEIQMSVLKGYLERRIQFNNNVQEALNFMDHLIRQWPSQNLLGIKRNFYKRNEKGRPLMDGAVVEVHKGSYVSVRLSHNLAQGGLGLALNADVANTCFWIGPQSFETLMCAFLATCDKRWKGITPPLANKILAPIKGEKGRWVSTDAFKQLRKMRGMQFRARHPNRPQHLCDKIYRIQDFAFDEKYGGEGGNARNVCFEHEGKQISVQDYFIKKYRAHLRYVLLPLIKLDNKGSYMPMEFAWIEPMQRYNMKLNPDQTAAMIKIAVTRPTVRKADIQQKVGDLQIPNDPFLRHYGVTFDSQFTKVEARVIAPPQVNFGQGTADPKFSGRWDLRGKKFFKQNVAPLQSWGFITMNNCVAPPQVQQFAKSFKTTFLGHGGKCTADPLIIDVPKDKCGHPANALEHAFNFLKSQRGYPQLLFIIVEHRNSPHYERLKKSADCRFGIMSQVVNAKAVMDNNGQYHSNVCMKVNAKLGGATSRTQPPWKSQPYYPKERPTMVIGADVSHGAPGGGSPSTAAMTMSVDPDATRFAASVETNGYRVEMITPKNIHFMFGQLVKQWKAGHGNAFPVHVIYMRDGVSEGQFAHVLEEEVSQMKIFFQTAAPKLPQPKFTVIIATKRHHIRFFPQKGDRNGNPLPGTIVEKEVTHPFMWDFYLNSHVAIQGTSRPVHYHVILDEMGIPVNHLQKMIYHQCYSYARSTTPVSLHPAVYYAHLASNRCRPHENIAASEGFRAGAKGHEVTREAVAKGKTYEDMKGMEAPPLLPLGGQADNSKAPAEGELRQRDFFRGTMWYI